MTLKKIFGKIHLWLGLFSGSIVFIVAVTGCIYVFEEEIRSLYEKKFWYVEVPENPVRYSLAEMKKNAEAAFYKDTPGISTIRHIDTRYFSDPERSQAFIFYNASPLIYKQIFVNPYSGEIIHVKNLSADIFVLSLELHRNLLLGPIGKEIIDYSCLLFLVLLITGIFLWWPRNRSAKKKRFKIRWSANPKKVNYDFHNVLGFYASWVGIILVLTGFVWAFTWFEDSVDWIANGGESTPPYVEVHSDTLQAGSIDNSIDKVFIYSHTKLIDAKRFYIGFPIKKEDPITLVSYHSNQVYYKHDHIYFDSYSGEIIKNHPYQDATNGDKINAMAYDIHIGKILGLPGQILAFSASLIIASLPITGFRIWLGRKKKQRVKQKADKKIKSSIEIFNPISAYNSDYKKS